MPDPEPTITLTLRLRRWRVSQTARLFASSRTARWLFVLTTWPFVHTIDRFRHVDPPARLDPALRWARTKDAIHAQEEANHV